MHKISVFTRFALLTFYAMLEQRRGYGLVIVQVPKSVHFPSILTIGCLGG
jgi:hypothetical protein